MDKSLYIALSGVNRAMRAQQVHANNLANLNTQGFRKDFVLSSGVSFKGAGHPSRVMSVATGTSSSMVAGAAMHTGRNLDVAVADAGWISVMDKEGKEAYTRAGSLRLGAGGQLITDGGRTVSGLGGAINIPPYRQIEIGNNGTISIVPVGEVDEPLAIGRLKLVNPAPQDMAKGRDGLFRRIDGEDVEQDTAVQVRSGYLEASNVNAVEEMVQFMNLSRQFELQFKVMKTAETLAASGDKLIRVE